MGLDRASMQGLMGKMQDALEEVFGGILVMDGVTYTVASGGGVREGEHEAGGFVDELGRLVRLRKSACPVMPPLGERVVLDGEEGRIVSVDERAYADAWTMRIHLPR